MSSISIPSTDARPAAPGPGARLVNVIVDPVAAFDRIATSAPWLLAFTATVFLRFASLFVFYHPLVTPLKLLGGVVFQLTTVAPLLVVASLVIWLAAKAGRIGVSWRIAFSIATHTLFAYTLATIAIASVAGALLPASSDVDVRNPPFTNPASLASESSGLTRALLGELDVRSAYAISLVWVGIRGAEPRASRARLAGVVVAIAVVRLAGVVGAGLLSR
jgi:hypothetical protein